MAISVYTGLMGSGKSYEVVSNVILDAIAAGRRIVTNVEGISNELIRTYIAEKRGIELQRLGEVVSVANADVSRDNFFPYYDDDKSARTDTVVQPGDLVCIDEAWRFWGTDCKLLKQHKSFFLEHRHFTHTDTHIACDLVLMIQDMGTLHRFVKNVVAFNFRTHKKVSLGLSKMYSIVCYEGHKQTKQSIVSSSVSHYKKEIFPLYSSFKGGASGKSVNADKRQNKFSSPKIWVALLTVPVLGFVCATKIVNFFHPPVTQSKAPSNSLATTTNVQSISKASTPRGKQAVVSDVWRIAGTLYVDGRMLVVLINGAGITRLESSSLFQNYGMLQVGQVDGEQISAWSGAPNKSNTFLPAPSSNIGTNPENKK